MKRIYKYDRTDKMINFKSMHDDDKGRFIISCSESCMKYANAGPTCNTFLILYKGNNKLVSYQTTHA